MKIYTKTGDDGTTGLFAGPRVAKDHPRIQAYGTVDELNAVLGTAIAELHAAELRNASPGQAETSENSNSNLDWCTPLIGILSDVQGDLFCIGAELATPDPTRQGLVLLRDERVTALENTIDRFEAELEPLKCFILPGGSRSACTLHVARTVCRRAEREIVSLAKLPQVAGCNRLIIYLNRLSDLLFSAARYVNAKLGVPERSWHRPLE